MNRLLLVALIILSMGVALTLALQLFRLLIGYKVTDKDIAILLFHLVPIYRIPFRKIKKIYSAPMYEVMLIPGLHFPSRVFSRRVVIERRNTWFKFAFLTPKDPDAFIADVKRLMVIS